MKTRATRVGDNYTISGSKMFITNGSAAQVYVVMAVTDEAANRSGV
jgi:alkylation response protein AidB-like acyl-CoA dehydrogenase